MLLKQQFIRRHYVIVSIRVGGLEAYKLDLEIPAKHVIIQGMIGEMFGAEAKYLPEFKQNLNYLKFFNYAAGGLHEYS